MKYSKIHLYTLKTWDDCQKAIEEIETDHRNYHGGIARWNSGFTTTMREKAKDKLQKIEDHADRIAIRKEKQLGIFNERMER